MNARFVAPADVGICIPAALHGRPSIRTACPKCARKRDDALHLNINADGTWVAFCHRCHTSFFSGVGPHTAPAALPSIPARPTRRPESIAATLRRLLPWKETLVEKYLLTRTRLVPPEDAHLFFEPRAWHPIERRNLPAMTALVTDAVTAAPLTLHRTYLRADGSGKANVARPKLLAAGLPKKNGVVRLCRPINGKLAVAEGIESATAVLRADVPAWATVDADNLASLPVIPGITELVIAADNDPTGLKAADELAARWTAENILVRIAVPPMPGQDFADLAVQS